jgi:hypothetical protein
LYRAFYCTAPFIAPRLLLRADLDIRVYGGGVISDAPPNFRTSNFRKSIEVI